ncbi:MAG: DUF5719 family protein [Actinomycetota bacterium]
MSGRDGGRDDSWASDDDPAAADRADDGLGGPETVGYDESGYDESAADAWRAADDEAEAPRVTGGHRRPRSRAARVVVLVVLLALLSGGLVLGRRTAEVPTVRVAAAGLDGPEVPPADAVSTAWYCAAGTSSDDGPQDETVYVANLSPKRITADVTVDPGGDEESRTVTLRVGPYERGSLPVSDVMTVDSPGVVVEVAGGAAIVEHEIRSTADIAMSPCAHSSATRWFFASGGTPQGATQTLELYNPFGDDAIVDIAFLTDGGVQEPQALQGFVVGRRSKVRVPVTDVVPRQERIATVVRTRTGRVVAEQVRTVDGTDGIDGLTLSLGVPSPRRQWSIPVGAAETGVAGAVSIANFGLTPASVEVSILLSGEGVLVPETIDVPSRSVVRFDPSERIPAGTAYSLVAQVQGDDVVVAEADVAGVEGVATTIGSAFRARRWALAGAPVGASSAVVAINRGPTPVTVELRAYTAGDVDSPRSAPAIVVAPGKSARFDLDEWGIDPDQVLLVSAEGPIVVGRETYLGGLSLALAVPYPS